MVRLILAGIIAFFGFMVLPPFKSAVDELVNIITNMAGMTDFEIAFFKLWPLILFAFVIFAIMWALLRHGPSKDGEE